VAERERGGGGKRGGEGPTPNPKPQTLTSPELGTRKLKALTRLQTHAPWA